MYSFRFRNNSVVDVYIYLGVTEREFGGSLYPDTAISRVRVGIPFRSGQTFVYEYHYKLKDTLCLFIFDAQVFHTYSWDEIKEGYKILKRYDLSREDIRRLNHLIVYPPDERMRDIKMYPPFHSRK
jgi:hypothetical protein